VTQEATRSPATSVYPTEAGRSEASLLGVGFSVWGATLEEIERAAEEDSDESRSA
jgi:hypothetical protein